MKRLLLILVALAMLLAGSWNDCEFAVHRTKVANPAVGICTGNSHTVILRSDGTVQAVGGNRYGQLNVFDWHDIVAVAAGTFHTVGLRKDGTVMAVGDNLHYQLDVEYWYDIVAVAAGDRHTVGLRADGTVVATPVGWSRPWNDEGQSDVADWRDIIAVAAGRVHIVGLRADGSVVAAGSNFRGQLDVDSWRNIIAVAAGGSHTVGLRSDGRVVAVGYNWHGQLNVERWRNIVAISAGDTRTLGLRANGTALVAGPLTDMLNFTGWRDLVAVSLGGWHTVGITSYGSVLATGSNRFGEIDMPEDLIDPLNQLARDLSFWPQVQEYQHLILNEEPIPLNFDLPYGFRVLTYFANQGVSAYTFEHWYTIQTGANAWSSYAKIITLNMRYVQYPQEFEQMNTAQLNDHTVYYSYAEFLVSDFRIAFEKDSILYDMSCRHGLGSLIILSQVILGGKDEMPAHWRGYVEHIPSGPEHDSLPFTLPDGFEKISGNESALQYGKHIFLLQDYRQRYFIIYMAGFEMYRSEWFLPERNRMILDDHTIYYRQIRHILHRDNRVFEFVSTTVYLEKDGVFYEIRCLYEMCDIELEDFLTLAKAIIRG